MASDLNHNQREEPVSIGIALISAAEAVTGLAIGFEAASLVGTIAIGVTVAGANYALSKTLSDKSSGFSGGANVGGINAPDSRGSVRQSAPVQRILYGRVRVGGAVYFIDDSKPPYLYLGLLLSARRISRVRNILIGTNTLQFSDIHYDQIITPIPQTGVDYSSHLRASIGLGAASQAIDPLIDAAFTNLDSSFRQRGIARATFEFKYGADREEYEARWGNVGIPNALLDVEGCPVYDPRDPTQDVSDETTWRYSNNAALIQADWLRQPYGVNFPFDRIDYDQVIDAANFDDELVGTLDGSLIKRHTIDGVVTLDEKPRDVMEAMLTANRGFVVQSQGRGWVASCQPKDPVLTIDDRLLIGGFEFRDDKAKRDTANTIRSRFSSSDREYQDIDGPILERDDLISADGEPLEVTVLLPFTSDHRIVQRLQKQYIAEARLPRSLSCKIKLRALGLDIGDVVRVSSSLFPRMDGLYRVEELGFLDDFSGIVVSLSECDPSIARDWNPETDEQEFSLPALDVS